MKTKPVVSILVGTAAALLTVNPIFAATPTTSSKQGPATTEEKSIENWSDRIYDEFQGMQQRMDHLFRDATRDLNKHMDWFDSGSFTSSVKLSEDKNHYVVRVSLPDRDVNNLTATVEPNNTLRIVAKEEQKERTTSSSADRTKGDAGSSYILGRYEQVLSLPGPIDPSKMTIERAGSTVTITLPKTASPGTAPEKKG